MTDYRTTGRLTTVNCSCSSPSRGEKVLDRRCSGESQSDEPGRFWMLARFSATSEGTVSGSAGLRRCCRVPEQAFDGPPAAPGQTLPPNWS
jgi:hypothetical protein